MSCPVMSLCELIRAAECHDLYDKMNTVLLKMCFDTLKMIWITNHNKGNVSNLHILKAKNKLYGGPLGGLPVLKLNFVSVGAFGSQWHMGGGGAGSWALALLPSPPPPPPPPPPPRH